MTECPGTPLVAIIIIIINSFVNDLVLNSLQMTSCTLALPDRKVVILS